MQGNARAFRVSFSSWTAKHQGHRTPHVVGQQMILPETIQSPMTIEAWHQGHNSNGSRQSICLCPQRLNGKIKIANCMMKRLWSTHWLHASEANSTSEAEELNEEMKVISRAKRCTAVERCRAIQMGAAWCSTNTHKSTNSWKSLLILIRWTSPWVSVSGPSGLPLSTRRAWQV